MLQKNTGEMYYFMDWPSFSAINKCNVSHWKPEGTLVQKIHIICIHKQKHWLWTKASSYRCNWIREDRIDLPLNDEILSQ